MVQNGVTVAQSQRYWWFGQEINGPPFFLSANGSAFSRRSAKHDQLPLSRLVLRHFRPIFTKFS